MAVVELAPEPPEPAKPNEVLFTQFLKDLTTCRSLVEVNIVAGLALQALLALQT